MKSPDIKKLAQLIRYWSLVSTTKAGSGHPTSSLSAADLMATLFFGGYFRFDIKKPANPNNDRLIFSKGHASPLFYALWAAANAIPEKELMTLRKFTSRLEGHPTMRFPYTEAATGSLGQGLSIGVGSALAAKYLDKLPYRTYVLLGDSEMAEGSVWEAMQSAAYYKLNNLIAILDVNRLGQRGETMYGWDIRSYKKKAIAFGWDVLLVDGHTVDDISLAYSEALVSKDKPVMIIAKTIKGKGVRFLEDQEGFHGKALNEHELESALNELGPVSLTLRGSLEQPKKVTLEVIAPQKANKLETLNARYATDELVATRKAYGDALLLLAKRFPKLIALDGEVSNSTYADIFKKAYPKRFFEMYIAEQNMIGAAVGLAHRGYIPFVSTFAAFMTRGFDQLRMARYSDANIKLVGSHAGVSIGEDGSSQMGLEDIAMFRSIEDCVVLYPSDAISTHKIIAEAAQHKGMVYIRTTRPATPLLYPESQSFPIGGSKILKQSKKDSATIVAAGITVYEALKAYEALKKKKVFVRVIDAYSIKPIDAASVRRAAQQTKRIITVEDHHAEGGLGEAVLAALAHTTARVTILAVRKMPRSGKMDELLNYEGISAESIVKAAVQK